MSNFLSKMPNISIPRSRFKQEFNHATSFQHGKLIPIDCFEIIPGDNVSLEISSLIRMSTPVAPIFGNIKAFLHAFFVPMRLVWDDAEKFYGDPSNHDKVQSITPVDPASVVIPNWNPLASDSAESSFPNSVASYLGKPFITSTHLGSIFISCLKERGYYCIWNENFRPSNLILPNLISKSSGTFTSLGTNFAGDDIEYYSEVLPVCKQYDYFTAATLSPQFGGSVSLPLLGTANVVGATALHSMSNGLKVGSAPSTPIPGGYSLVTAGVNGFVGAVDTESTTSLTVNATNLVADLTNASSATVNQLRYAFQVQKYLERSNYGSRFFEILNAHYGVQSPDGRLQRPDRLGYHEFYININQVLATADTSNATLGKTGAVSVTGDKCNLFNAAFTEPGYLYVMLCTKYDRSYSGGILREDKRKTRFEFYSPEFANLGDMPIYKNEIALYKNFGSESLFADNEVFGYQEHWAEYRYRKDRVSGLLNPTSTAQLSLTGSMDFWTLADVFDSLDSNPVTLTLNNDFLFEDRAALARVLVTGSEGPDYIADFHFKYIVTRELPLYSIPGLIDHFGAL